MAVELKVADLTINDYQEDPPSDLEETATYSFLTEEDYETFRQNGDDLDRCIAAFQRDMPKYLRQRWLEKYEPDIASFECAENPIEKFNEIIGYPSWGASAIIDDLFTAVPDEDFELLSDDTFTILGYFYNIQIHLSTEIHDDY